jgi:hypothetical protein
MTAEDNEEEDEEDAFSFSGKHIFSPSQRCPHQHRPSALMMHVPVPQHRGSSDMRIFLSLNPQRPAVVLAFSQAIKMRSGVAGASMWTTAWWLALAATASLKAKKVDRPNINGGSPVALLLKGVGLLFWFSNKDTLKCSGMSPATGIL